MCCVKMDRDALRPFVASPNAANLAEVAEMSSRDRQAELGPVAWASWHALGRPGFYRAGFPCVGDRAQSVDLSITRSPGTRKPRVPPPGRARTARRLPVGARPRRARRGTPRLATRTRPRPPALRHARAPTRGGARRPSPAGCGSRRPGVRAEMVMVAAGRQEERARVAPGPVEAECIGVERAARARSPTCRCTWPIAVPAGIPATASPAARPSPATSTGSVAITVASTRPPRLARSVGVDLDAEAVGVPQVECLAHQVIRSAGARADSPRCAHESAERGRSGSRMAKW